MTVMFKVTRLLPLEALPWSGLWVVCFVPTRSPSGTGEIQLVFLGDLGCQSSYYCLKIKRRSKLGVLRLFDTVFSADWSLLIGWLVGPRAWGLGGLTVTTSLLPNPRDRGPRLGFSSVLAFSARTPEPRAPPLFLGMLLLSCFCCWPQPAPPPPLSPTLDQPPPSPLAPRHLP